MSIYYYGKLVSFYNPRPSTSEPVSLTLRKASPGPGLSSSDEIRALSERNVPEGTFLEEKPVDRSGGEPGSVRILRKVSSVGDILKTRDDYQTYTKTKFVIRHYQDA